MIDLADPAVLSYPSKASSQELAAAFPTVLADVERMVYEFVADAAANGISAGLPALSFYADRARAAAEGRKVPVVRGWPAYPGKVPAIGVASGPETEDQQADAMQGGFAGTVFAHQALTFPADGSGLTFPANGSGLPMHSNIVAGTAEYFSEPLYQTVVVQLIHENREERDRLHDELRRLLFPLRTRLLERTSLVKKVRVDAEKTEFDGGPPMVETPFLLYISLFTVHVYSELLEARNVAGPESVVARIDVTASAADTAP